MPKFTIASVPERVGLADYLDRDVALWPTDGVKQYETSTGDGEGVPCRVYVLDPDAGPVDAGELVAFQTVVRKQLAAHHAAAAGSWYVGRVDKSKAYYQLVPPSEDGLEVADALPDEPAGLAAEQTGDHELKPDALS